jgi:hypothetical protein
MVLNATFNNSSVISWQSVLLVEETGVPRKNHELSIVAGNDFTGPFMRKDLRKRLDIRGVHDIAGWLLGNERADDHPVLRDEINFLVLDFMVLNATFNNSSVISWQSVLLVEETGVPGENHRHVASH